MAFTQNGSSSMTVPRPKWKSFVRSARIVDGGKSLEPAIWSCDTGQ